MSSLQRTVSGLIKPTNDASNGSTSSSSSSTPKVSVMEVALATLATAVVSDFNEIKLKQNLEMSLSKGLFLKKSMPSPLPTITEKSAENGDAKKRKRELKIKLPNEEEESEPKNNADLFKLPAPKKPKNQTTQTPSISVTTSSSSSSTSKSVPKSALNVNTALVADFPAAIATTTSFSRMTNPTSSITTNYSTAAGSSSSSSTVVPAISCLDFTDEEVIEAEADLKKRTDHLAKEMQLLNKIMSDTKNLIDLCGTLSELKEELQKGFSSSDLFSLQLYVSVFAYAKFSILLDFLKATWPSIKEDAQKYCKTFDNIQIFHDLQGKIDVKIKEYDEFFTAISGKIAECKKQFPQYQETLSKMFASNQHTLAAQRSLTETELLTRYVHYLQYSHVFETTGISAAHQVILSKTRDVFTYADGFGMANLGNTCWLNAFLQVTVPLEALILNPHCKPMEKLGTEKMANFTMRCTLLKLLKLFIIQRLRGPILSKRIVELFLKFFRSPEVPDDLRLGAFEQQDGRAFLNMILSSMNVGFHCLTRRSCNNDTELQREMNPQATIQIALGAPLEQVGGYLFVELVAHHFHQHEVQDKWKTHASYTQNKWIETAPEVLVVDIERLYFEEESKELFCARMLSLPETTNLTQTQLDEMYRIKQQSPVQDKNEIPLLFPENGIATWKIFDEKKTVAISYEIIAFTRHSGTAVQGHWTACRKCHDGQWRFFDDKVKPLILTTDNQKTSVAEYFKCFNQVILRKLSSSSSSSHQ